MEYVTQFETEKFTYNYSLIYEYGVPYLSLDNGEERWLILISDELLLIYNSESNKPFFTGVSVSSGISLETIYSTENIEATSTLTENGHEYAPQDLYFDSLEKPWVEGVLGGGLGEKIIIQKPGAPVRDVYISIGYVSFSMPDLYMKNSRIKKLRIVDTKNGDEIIKELDDTPFPQRISFPDRKWRSIEIEILEVYKGTLYEDTCINFIKFGA
jgi:hypothetical protein